MVVEDAGEYRWSSFACHALGQADALLDPVVPYDALGERPATRQRRWSAYVHRTPDEAELAALRRSTRTRMPFGEETWVHGLGSRLGLDLALRPRGRPRKAPPPGK